MAGDHHNENTTQTPTRRHTLKLAAGTATAVTFGTASTTAQEDQIQSQDQDRIQWTFDTGNWVDSSPTVVDGTVFVGSNDSNLYAVDAETGTQQWVFETSTTSGV